MYKHIVNPATGRKVNVNGKIGKQVLQQYKEQLGGERNFPGMSQVPTGMPGMSTGMPGMPTGMPGLHQAGVMAGINADVYKIVKEQIEQTCRELIQWPRIQNPSNFESFKPAYFLADKNKFDPVLEKASKLIPRYNPQKNSECGKKLDNQYDEWSNPFWVKLKRKISQDSVLDNKIGGDKIYDYVLEKFEIYHLNASKIPMSDDGTRGTGVYGMACDSSKMASSSSAGLKPSDFVFPYPAFPIDKDFAEKSLESDTTKALHLEVVKKIDILNITPPEKLKYALFKNSADEIIQEYNKKNNADDKLKVLKNWYNNLINALDNQPIPPTNAPDPAQQSMSPTGPVPRANNSGALNIDQGYGLGNLIAGVAGFNGGGKRRNAKRTSKKRNASKKRRNTSKNNNRR